MKRFTVALSVRASQQLTDLWNHIEANSGAARATTFVDGIVDYCDGLATFPERGTKRHDILPGLRVVGYRRRATIAFTVRAQTVVILGVFYGGQDYEAVRKDEPD
jgi:toxin ParE1/3/4